jgi:hypothetical protein
MARRLDGVGRVANGKEGRVSGFILKRVSPRSIAIRQSLDSAERNR